MPAGDLLTQEVKDVALRQGAALVGIANVERFDPMPPYYDAVPRGITRTTSCLKRGR